MSHKQPPAVTEERFTRLCVEFANSGQLTGALLHTPGLGLLALVDRATKVGEITGHVQTPALVALRADLRKDLAAIIAMRLPPTRVRQLAREAIKVKITPSYEIDPNTDDLISSYHYLFEGPEGAIAYGTLLIRGREYRNDLRRCRLESCGRFFFKSDTPGATGRDRDKYCEPKHREEAHKATSAERTRRWRARKAK